MENKNYENTASLKDLIFALLKNWKILAVCTVTALVIGIAYSVFMITPGYESSISVVISVPASVENKYGVYSFSSVTNTDIANEVRSTTVLAKTIDELELDMTAAQLSSIISVSGSADSSSFSIVVTTDTQENANRIVTAVSQNFLEEVNVKYREFAIETFADRYELNKDIYVQKLENEQAKLAGLKDELSQEDQFVTVKRSLLSNPILAAQIAEAQGVDLADLADATMYEETINPIYVQISSSILASKSNILAIEIDIANNETLLSDLVAEQAAVDAYRENGDLSGMKDESLNVLRSAIRVNDNPVYSSAPVSTNRSLIIILSLLAGLAVGAIAALTKNYVFGK